MITLTVEGMTCSGCVKSVKQALAKVDPTALVEVDLGSGRVDVTSALPRPAIERAIEGAGYDVKH
jgi:copper chaperone